METAEIRNKMKSTNSKSSQEETKRKAVTFILEQHSWRDDPCRSYLGIFHPLASFLLAGYLSQSLSRLIHSAGARARNIQRRLRYPSWWKMTLPDVIRRPESGSTGKTWWETSHEDRDCLVSLSFLIWRINKRQENKTNGLRNYSRAGICDRSRCETRIREWIGFTPLHPVAFNDEYLSNQAKAEM